MGAGEIHDAVRFGRTNDVVRLISADPTVLVAGDTNGFTALHIAAHTGNARVAGMLVTMGADVNATNKFGISPLLHASARGNSDVVDLLIQNHAKINHQGVGGLTPLHAASAFGSGTVVKRLIDAGADVRLTLVNGDTPLHAAANRGHTDVVSTLLKAGGLIDATNALGITPLHYAVFNARVLTASNLVASGASTTNRDKEGRNVLELLKVAPQIPPQARLALETILTKKSFLRLRCRRPMLGRRKPHKLKRLNDSCKAVLCKVRSKYHPTRTVSKVLTNRKIAKHASSVGLKK